MELTDQQILDAVETHGSIRSAAKALGVPKTTFREWVLKANAGEAPVPTSNLREAIPGKASGDIDKRGGKGWLEVQDFVPPTPEGVLEKFGLDPAIWEVTRLQPNQWQGFYKKGKKGNESHEVVTMHSLRVHISRRIAPGIELALETLAGRIQPLPKPRRDTRTLRAPTEPQMVVFGLYDAHIGALAWDGETEVNNDTSLAVERCKKAIDDLLDRLEPHDIVEVIVPMGNDFMHFDNERGETTSGRVTVDFDSRYGRVIVACHDVAAYQIDEILRRLKHVAKIKIIYVGGNHDRLAALNICHWLQARYQNEPRVEVDTTMHPRKYVTYGGCLIGLAHGDGLKLTEVYRLMAEEAREEWAKATCREMHVGDKHHRKQMDLKAVDTYGKVTVRQNSSIAPKDNWSTRMGYESVRCADVWRYTTYGFIGMDTTYTE